MNDLAYYNDNEPYVVEWLGNLAKGGLIIDGEIDGRSIQEVTPDDLRVFRRCHFFAGIGGWDYALRLAGWPSERSVWTGSCPCQPFSAAGRGGGFEDERHLWPVWKSLITDCRPPTIFGEQVASKDGRLWLDRVRADLEKMGYAVGAADLCAASLNAPHIRQRLWWVADATDYNRGSGKRRKEEGTGADQERWGRSAGSRGNGRMGDSLTTGLEIGTEPSGLRHALWQERQTALSASPWREAHFIPCGDGKARRIESGTLPLASGIPARVGKLRAYGNAIVPQVAAEFIMAYLERGTE